MTSRWFDLRRFSLNGGTLSATDFQALLAEAPHSTQRQTQRARITASRSEQIAFLRRLILFLETGQGFRSFLVREYENATLALDRRKWQGLIMDGTPFNPFFIAELFDLVTVHGYSFSEACRQFPRMFSPQTVKILEVCERTGNFGGRFDQKTGRVEPSVLEIHLQFLERLLKVRTSLIQKLILPVATLLVAIVVILLFIWKVIPVIGELLSSLNVGLNPMTASLMYLGSFLEHYWWLVLLLLVGGPLLYLWQRRRSPALRLLESRCLLRIPVLNQYLVQLAAYEWTGVFMSMVGIGDLRAGLIEAADSISLECFRRTFTQATEAFLNGEYQSIAEALAQTEPFFGATTSFYRALVAYKDSGSTLVLDDFRREMEARLDDTLQRFIEFITPTMTIILGLVVGYVILAIYIPIIQVVGALAK